MVATVFLEVLLPVLQFFGSTSYIKRLLNVLNGSNFYPVSYTHVGKILEKKKSSSNTGVMVLFKMGGS